MARRRPLAILVLVLWLAPALRGQSTSASISGRITDPTRARIVDATVAAVNTGTNARNQTTTNGSGEYSLPDLPPGLYRIEVEKTGFKRIIKPDVFLHVQDALAIDFEMQVGPTSESVTVQAGAPLLQTTEATVSTLIDNRFVDNMPLNGRSFGSLIDLTPGVVLPATNFYDQGQFSVNGQRPDANYFTVDGVSANIGTSATSLGQGGAGQLPAGNAFGGMSNLASLDAMQEFRIQTSTFAPEYGRTPGGQVSVVTKSGTNDFHGDLFEYFRNDALDANNWFADNMGLKKPALRQNDFGGVFGGPIKKGRLFFFASYEGLRVRQPQVANTYEPTLATIQSAPAVVQPLLNAFPKPNGPNLGNGTAQFTAGYSDPSSLNAGSIRIDYALSPKITIFGRYNNAPSNIEQRAYGQLNYSDVLNTHYGFQTVTLGSSQAISPHMTNEFRFNYSRSSPSSFLTLDNFGGAVPPSNSVLYPSFAPQDSSFAFFGDLNPYGVKFDVGKLGDNPQQQFNVTDNLSYSVRSHQLKFGIDYRRLNTENGPFPYQLEYVFGSLSNVLANKVPEAFVLSRFPSTLIFPNWSLFAQDTWSITRSLTITYGLRWDYNGSPSSPNGTLPFTVNQVNDLATATLAPAGTPLWRAQKDDFAPRLGIAWNPRSHLVIRAGAGIFYDLGYSLIAEAAGAFPYGQQNLILNTSFPLSTTAAAPPPFKTTPPVSSFLVMDPNHRLPRTYEWNAALEQSFGSADVLTVTYVGAAGRQLVRNDIYEAPNPEFTGQFEVFRNGANSSYNALQMQYRHRLKYGLQTLFSYTWSHSIDDVSSDAYFQNVPPGVEPASQNRGSSDYDIRSTFSGAVSYTVPGPGNGWYGPLLRNWGVNSIVYARSALPVNVVTGNNPFPGTILSGAYSVQRPNVVPGVPFYISDPSAPGGWIINKAAFTDPVSGQGDLGRNALRGFDAWQIDFSVQRRFALSERFRLQSEADFFNILNRPNFGNPISYLTSPQFGEATQMLNSYLGAGGQFGGLNPLYQIGGPRSIQLALKLQF